MKSAGLAADSPAKSRQRKWVGYGRPCSNALWHTDWHVMKDTRMRGLNLITYPDDASRCVTAAAPFREATSENAVTVPGRAICGFGTPATILSDNGSCLVGRGGRKRQAGTRTPTLFENELLALNVGLINSRPYHPQANGKLERFHKSLEDEIWNCLGPDGHIGHYDADRLRFSLDMDNYETPMMAFRNKRADEETRMRNPNWVEGDING